MKKLFKNSAIVLVLISLFAISCEKEKAAPPAPAPAPAIGFKAICTPKGTNNPTVVEGDTIEVKKETLIRIEPTLGDKWKKCKGKWTVKVEGDWKEGDYGIIPDLNTGATGFIPNTPGTYTITFTYTCPDGSSTPPATITIIVT